MRIKKRAVLALALFGSAPVFGQADKDAAVPAPMAGAPAAATLPPAAKIGIGVTPTAPPFPGVAGPTAPPIPGVPGPLDYPTVGEGDCAVPAYCVPHMFWLHADYVLWICAA